jgi:putative transposase
MCNDAIRIALAEKPKNRFKLIELAYPRLREYGLHSDYILASCEIAYSSYNNKKRRSRPRVRSPFLKLYGKSFVLNHLLLRISTSPKNFIYLTLQGSAYHLSFIDDPALEARSVTITSNGVFIAFSKEVCELEPKGRIGVDVNEHNITWSGTSGKTARFDTSEIAELKERYRAITARIARRTQKDRRVMKHLLGKYGERERNRSVQAFHRISKSMVAIAKENHSGIIMERLTGIRKLYRRGNGKGRFFRERMNSWMFREPQRQVEYKAAWEGVPIAYAYPKGTSSNCPDCGSRVVKLVDRKLYCPKCDKTWDRDVLASKNLMAAVVPAARPTKRSDEGESKTQEEAGNPPSRWEEAKPDGMGRQADRTQRLSDQPWR